VDGPVRYHVDHECDLTTLLPCEDSTFDAILSDVLEHIPMPDHLWKQLARVLRPGGTVLMNVPFRYGIHAHPHDFRRYTEFALRRLVESSGLQIMDIKPIGGLVEVTADIAGKAVAKLPVAGRGMSAVIQAAGSAFGRGKTRRVLQKSAHHFPLGLLHGCGQTRTSGHVGLRHSRHAVGPVIRRDNVAPALGCEARAQPGIDHQ